MTTEPDWIRDALSSPRFAPYLVAASGHVDTALRLYWWNVDVSSAFYAPLHCLEVCLRNALHLRLSTRFGQSNWWDAGPLDDVGLRMVTASKRKVATRAHRPGTSDDVMAELTFGFWVSLMSRHYDRSLWVPSLHRAFAGTRRPRAALHQDLVTMLFFRNRIMHHEPIHRRHLEKDHETVLRLLGYLSPEMVKQLALFDRVDDVLKRRPDVGPPELPGDGR
jgi:hypothetical protein